jgi:dUTP pyrophosphatase
MSLAVAFTRLPHGEGLPDPTYQTAGAAGLDLPAAVPADAPLVIPPGEWRLVPTGLAMAIPPGWEGQVRPRSGLALRHGVTVLNAPGTIDSDYRGEIAVVLVNHGEAPFVVARGERIAQLVFCAVGRARLEIATHLQGTIRGAGGYGSTGT